LSRFIGTLTARQYGGLSVNKTPLWVFLAKSQPAGMLLPDAASGQGPVTLARKLSRCAPRERSEQRGCKAHLRWSFGG